VDLVDRPIWQMPRRRILLDFSLPMITHYSFIIPPFHFTFSLPIFMQRDVSLHLLLE
jgi:hypothetical protein